MKNLTFFLICLCPIFSFAQEITFLNAANVSGVINSFGDPQELSGYIDVINETNESLDVFCRFEEVQTDVSDYTYKFCWNLCYGPSIIISPASIPIEPNQTIYGGFEFLEDANGQYSYYENGDTIRVQGFAGYYESDQIGATIIRHFFYDQDENYVSYKDISYCLGNIGDPFCENFNSIQESQTSTNFLSAPYPNPTNDQTVKLDFDIKSVRSLTVVVSNALGQSVKTQEISKNKGTLLLDIEGLTSGFYTISLVGEHQIIATEKLQIQ